MKRKSFNWTLPPEIESRLGENTFGRQRAIAGGGHLLIILHSLPATGSTERDPVVFLRTPAGEYLCNGLPGGQQRLRQLLGQFRSKWEELDNRYDSADSADDLFHLLAELAPLNRITTNTEAALQSARELVRDDRFLIGIRDEATEVSRAYDLLVADAQLKLNYRSAKDAEFHARKATEMAAAQHKLNILAALTFPLMAMATLLGMNLRNGLENRSPVLFGTVLLAGFGIGFGVKAWVTRK